MDSQSELRHAVDQLLHVFQQGYEPFVITAIKSMHGNQWLDVLKSTPDLRVSTQSASLRLDATALVRIMLHHWDGSFARVLSSTERNMLYEVRHVRNKWAHQNIIHVDDVDRLADNIARLLVAINAANADHAKQLRESLRQQRYRTPRTNPGSRWWIVVVVLVCIGGLGGTGWWLWSTAQPQIQRAVAPVATVTRTSVPLTAESAYPCQPGQIKANPRTMIYHPPDGAYYAITKNSEVQCFDSVDAVESAGFRRAKR